MRTLVDIDEKLLEEAMKLTGAKTKKETIRLALVELTRSRLRRQLKEMAGSGVLKLDVEELRRLRYKRQAKHHSIEPEAPEQ